MLRERREAKGMSLRELARMARVGRTYIEKLESGDKKNPSLMCSTSSPAQGVGERWKRER
jgi:predicted transcriptional regulator